MTTDTRAQGTWGKVTEEAAQRLRERIGVDRDAPSSFFRYNSNYVGKYLQITSPYVVRYATGIADNNPLYLDPEYAAGSPWGAQWCPPGVLSWTERVNGATDGFPGCHTIWRGCELEWNRPVLVGDQLAALTRLVDVTLVDSSFSSQAAVQNYATDVHTAEGEHLGTYKTSWHRFSRGEAKRAERYAETPTVWWTDEQLAEIAQEYKRQNTQRRGSEILYWEDVTPGTAIPYIVKGPTTLTSKLAFESINFPGGWVVGHELALELFESHPNLPIRNEENALEPPVSIHWTNERCQTYLGMPKAYEAGYERLHWFGQLLMNWMGDHGALRRLAIQYRNFHWQGDLIRLYATVTGTRREGALNLVDLSLETRTHRDEVTTTGEATVALPSSVSGTGPASSA